MAIAIVSSFIRQFKNDGTVNSGGTINVYAAGTTTPLTLYSNTGLSVTVTNPITLDGGGRHAITYIAAGTSYKLLIKDSAGNTVETIDNIDPGVAVGSGALPVGSGGTGSTSAGGARTNLGVPSQSEVDDIATDVSTIETRLGTTGATSIAKGTTAQRPGVPNEDDIRYNTTLSQYEAYTGAAFSKVVTVPVLPGDVSASFLIGYTVAYQTSNSAIAGTTPVDDTIPQISEGAEVVTLTTPTPQSTSSKFLLIFNAQVQNGNGDLQAIFHLHKSGQTDALSLRYTRMTAAADVKEVAIVFVDSPASSSPVTYSVRAGNASGINMFINGTSSGRVGGGASRATLLAVEIKG
jgi:hypothetical protein